MIISEGIVDVQIQFTLGYETLAEYAGPIFFFFLTILLFSLELKLLIKSLSHCGQTTKVKSLRGAFGEQTHLSRGAAGRYIIWCG